MECPQLVGADIRPKSSASRFDPKRSKAGSKYRNAAVWCRAATWVSSFRQTDRLDRQLRYLLFCKNIEHGRRPYFLQLPKFASWRFPGASPYTAAMDSGSSEHPPRNDQPHLRRKDLREIAPRPRYRGMEHPQGQDRVQHYLDAAEHCEERATSTREPPTAQATFAEAARCWRELARYWAELARG
jgi:hypothetical protein